MKEGDDLPMEHLSNPLSKQIQTSPQKNAQSEVEEKENKVGFTVYSRGGDIRRRKGGVGIIITRTQLVKNNLQRIS